MSETAISRGSLRGQHGATWAFLMARVINPVMDRLLASRFHRWIGSDMMMVLCFRGRRSGRSYRFPIGYQQVGSDLVCYSPFRWWTNLQGGGPVSVILRGRRLSGTADVATEAATVAAGMAAYLRHNPGDAFFFHVKVRDGEPDAADVERAARENVQIRIRLSDPEGA